MRGLFLVPCGITSYPQWRTKVRKEIKLKVVFHPYDGLIKANVALNLTRVHPEKVKQTFLFFYSVGVTLAIIAPV